MPLEPPEVVGQQASDQQDPQREKLLSHQQCKTVPLNSRMQSPENKLETQTTLKIYSKTGRTKQNKPGSIKLNNFKTFLLNANAR